jgi:chromosome segregation ATPase
MANKWKLKDNGGLGDTFPIPLKASTPENRTSRTSLIDALRDLGLRDIDDVSSCSDSVVSTLWKLISMSQEGSRSLLGERERTARLEHELKVSRSRSAKLADEIDKLKREHASALAECNQREEVLRSKLDSLGKSRTDWEKVALEYRGREKHFVAEIKKQETEYSRFQEKVRRSMSLSNRTFSINDKPFPPPTEQSRRIRNHIF